MTRDEIIAMKPGPELDSLVATKVMGWVNIDDGWYERFDEDALKLVRYSWDPSTDIYDAWKVVEKVLSVNKNWHFNLVVDVDGCAAAFNDKEDIYKEILGVGETVPEAICKAGLLAVMEV